MKKQLGQILNYLIHGFEDTAGKLHNISLICYNFFLLVAIQIIDISTTMTGPV